MNYYVSYKGVGDDEEAFLIIAATAEDAERYARQAGFGPPDPVLEVEAEDILRRA